MIQCLTPPGVCAAHPGAGRVNVLGGDSCVSCLEIALVMNQRAAHVLHKLVESLPRCGECRKPATRAFKRGENRWCDEHAPAGCPDYPRAKALRDAQAVERSPCDRCNYCAKFCDNTCADARFQRALREEALSENSLLLRVSDRVLEFDYTNHRGERGRRRIVPLRVWYGSTAWHPEAQWMLRAWCCDRQDVRDFPLNAVMGSK